MHVPDRDEAIRRMVASLRPGGWLLIEDFDVALQPLACPFVDGSVAQGHVIGEEIERHLAALAEGRLDVAVPPLVSVRGRRP